MAKISSIETNVKNEMSVSFEGITEKDKEVILMADIFRKIFDAEFSLGCEAVLSLSIKYDSNDIPILKAKASLKEKDVHSDQLSLFDFNKSYKSIANE